MSFAEIEAELERLSPDELRRLALESWAAFVQKEAGAADGHECDETNPRLLAELDEAIAKADTTPGQGHSATAVRSRLNGWISR